jgi:hypothetical protein
VVPPRIADRARRATIGIAENGPTEENVRTGEIGRIEAIAETVGIEAIVRRAPR